MKRINIIFRTAIERIIWIWFKAWPKDGHLCLYQGIYYELKRRIRSNAGIWLFFFTLMFLFPLLLTIINGTAISNEMYLSCLPGSISYKILNMIIHTFPPNPTLEKPFLEDYIYIFISSILWPIHSILIYIVLTRISNVFKDLFQKSILLISNEEYQDYVNTYNRKANGWEINLIIIGLSIFFVVLGSHWRSNESWWGDLSNGFIGIISFYIPAFIIIHQVVMYVAKGLIVVVFMWNLFLRTECVVALQLFHPDKVHGMSKLGEIYILIWVGNIIHSTFLIMLSLIGFFPITILYIVIILIIYAFVWPIVSYVPVYLTHIQMKKYKESGLEKISNAIQTKYQAFLNGVSVTPLTINRVSVVEIGSLVKVYKIVEDMKEYPFSYRIVRPALLLYYILQISIALFQLWIKIDVGNSL